MTPDIVHKLQARAVGIFRLVAAFLLFALMVLTCVDVLGRYFFNRPFYGGLELTEITLAGVVFFALPILTYRGEHVVVDLISLPGRRIRRVQRALANLLGAVICVALARQLWLRGERLDSTGVTTIQIEIPMNIVAYTISVLLGLTALVFVLRAAFSPPDILKTDEIAK